MIIKKMKNTLVTIISILTVLIISNNIYANELQQFFLEFPPYWVKIPNSENYSGDHYRLMQKVYQAANLNVTMKYVPYSRQKLNIGAPEAAFMTYGHTEGNDTIHGVYFCTPPARLSIRAYTIADDINKAIFNTEEELVEKISKINEQGSKEIVVIHGLPLGTFNNIKNNKKLNILNVRTPESAIKMLQSKRAKYILMYQNLFDSNKHLILNYEQSNIVDFEISAILGYPSVTPKKYPNGKELCKQVFDAYNTLVNEKVIHPTRVLLQQDI